MRGYYTANGYMGFVTGEGFRLFESDKAYYEHYHEINPELCEYSRDDLNRQQLI